MSVCKLFSQHHCSAASCATVPWLLNDEAWWDEIASGFLSKNLFCIPSSHIWHRIRAMWCVMAYGKWYGVRNMKITTVLTFRHPWSYHYSSQLVSLFVLLCYIPSWASGGSRCLFAPLEETDFFIRHMWHFPHLTAEQPNAGRCKWQSNEWPIEHNGLNFSVMRCEHPAEPIHKLLLKTFCRVYQLCQLAPGRRRSHRTICVCGHQASGSDTSTVYTCPRLNWHCTTASSTCFFAFSSKETAACIHLYFPRQIKCLTSAVKC